MVQNGAFHKRFGAFYKRKRAQMVRFVRQIWSRKTPGHWDTLPQKGESQIAQSNGDFLMAGGPSTCCERLGVN